MKIVDRFLDKWNHVDEWRWSRLAAYNSEVSRGIVHTPEYDAKMAEEQRQFDAWRKAGNE
jgi:hypothetical protein